MRKRKPRVLLSYEQKTRIVKRIADGESVNVLAIEYDVRANTVYKLKRGNPAGSYSPKLKLRHLAMLPANNNGLPVQTCAPFSARLSVAACAERHDFARTSELRTACSGCEDGRRNLLGRKQGWVVT